MDLARRLVKIARTNGGVAMFTSVPKPNPIVGFVVVYNNVSYLNASFTNEELATLTRNFLIVNFAVGDGIAIFRRNSRSIIGNFKYFVNQADAEAFARANQIQYVYDLVANTSINLGSYEPNLVGDGVSDE